MWDEKGRKSLGVTDGVVTLHQSRNDNTVFGISKKKREKFEVISWKLFTHHASHIPRTAVPFFDFCFFSFFSVMWRLARTLK